MEAQGMKTGVACFYQEYDDIYRHKKIISFMIENDLIKRTKSGRYYNNSFKLDLQTRAGEYGPEFKGSIHLADFIDLDSGKWIYNDTQ